MRDEAILGRLEAIYARRRFLEATRGYRPWPDPRGARDPEYCALILEAINLINSLSGRPAAARSGRKGGKKAK